MLKSIFGYFLVLLFSRSVLITPVPIDIDTNQKLINSPEPLNILNERAALYIHLANLTKEESGEIIMNRMQYPGADKIKPIMCGKDNKCIPLAYEGLALGQSSVEAIYSADWNGRDKTGFTSVRISSDVALRGIKLRWANSGK